MGSSEQKLGSFSNARVPAREEGCVFQRRRVREVSSGVVGVLPVRDGKMEEIEKKKLNRMVRREPSSSSGSLVAPPV